MSSVPSINKVQVLVKKLDKFDYPDGDALPRYQTEGSAGFDLRAQLNHLDEHHRQPDYPNIKNASHYISHCENTGRKIVEILPGGTFAVPTRLSFQIPDGYELQIRCRSGLSLKTTLFCPNAPGTIDSDYRGEVHVIFANYGKEPQFVAHGDRIAQAVLAPVARAVLLCVDLLDLTSRGSGAFGSTGLT